jgi:hypothetical protein
MIPIIIKQENGPSPGLVAVHSVPRLGELVVYDGERYEVIEIEHQLPDIVVWIAPRLSSRRVWR